jgi:hypothetical protein
VTPVGTGSNVGSLATDRGLTRALIAAYALSNRRFPQTRFYFVVDFCRRLSLEDFRRFRAKGLALRPKTLRGLAKFGSNEHLMRKVRTILSQDQIAADVVKMVLAVNDVVSIYAQLRGRPDMWELTFLSDIRAMKTRIDEIALSASYLDFISPPGIGDGPVVIRSENEHLRRYLVPALGDSPLAHALRPQIARSVSLLR